MSEGLKACDERTAARLQHEQLDGRQPQRRREL
jgi:hypothetical protein